MLRSIPVRWGFVVIWMAVIFYWSSQSSVPTASNETLDYLMKKGAHFCEYSILSILVLRAIYPTERLSIRHLLLPFVVTVGYAATDEFHQIWTSNRHPSLLDVGIDSAGALLSLVVYASRTGRWEPRWSWRRSKPHPDRRAGISSE